MRLIDILAMSSLWVVLMTRPLAALSPWICYLSGVLIKLVHYHHLAMYVSSVCSDRSSRMGARGLAQYPGIKIGLVEAEDAVRSGYGVGGSR